jgi:hypothetical protein
MVTGSQKTVHSHGAEKEREPAGPRTGTGSEDACRCKEASRMSPRELLKLMVKDLAFWKKTDKE